MAQTVESLKPNLERIRADLAFFTARWGELGVPCWLELRAFAPDRQPQISKFRPDAAGLDLAAEWAVTMNTLRLNVYAVRNPIRDGVEGSASDDDILAAFYLWADADDEAAAGNVHRFDGPKWTAALLTGTVPSKRVHVYWELTEPAFNMEAWRDMQTRIAAHFRSDRKVVNPSRIMRVSGTVSWPAPHKVQRGYVSELTSLRTEYPDDDEREPLEFERALRVWPETVAAPSTPAASSFIDTGPQPMDRERARIQALSGEEWHNAVIKLVASYVAKGLADGEIHALTDPLTLPGYTVEQTRREVQTAIDGARRKGFAPEVYATPEAIEFDAPPVPEEEAKSRLEWFDDIRPSLDAGYIVKGMLDAGAMSVLYGASNSGKTFFALDLAYHVATGQTWRDRRVKGGGVLYLAAEGGRGIVNRISAIQETSGGELGVPLALRRAGLDLLRSNADLQQIVDLAAEVKGRAGSIALLVIDTLSRVIAGGDENSAQDMTAFIRNVDALRAAIGCHVMLVHHTGKDAARGARGHSSLRAATDTEIEVSNEEGARLALVTKQRDHPGGEDFGFTLKAVQLGVDGDGDDVFSAVVETAGSEEGRAVRDRRRGLGGTQKVIAETFDQMLGEGLGKPNPGGVGMPETGRFWAVDASELRRLVRGKLVVSDTRSAFNKALRSLVDDRGLFVAGENMIWCVDRPAGKTQ